MGYPSTGPFGDQDGSLYGDQEISGGAEMQDTEEESSHSNLIRERRKYVVFIEIIVCSLTLFKLSVNKIHTVRIID